MSGDATIDAPGLFLTGNEFKGERNLGVSYLERKVRASRQRHGGRCAVGLAWGHAGADDEATR